MCVCLHERPTACAVSGVVARRYVQPAELEKLVASFVRVAMLLEPKATRSALGTKRPRKFAQVCCTRRYARACVWRCVALCARDFADSAE